MRDRFFGSDNSAPVHPQIMDALARVNNGHAVAYGDDPFTAEATNALRKVFGSDARVFFVYSGTGANVIGLSAALFPHEAVICTTESHVNYDECGAVENFSGSKLLTADGHHGRISVEQIESFLGTTGEVHHSQPRVVSITQTTECGTVYSPQLIRDISSVCRSNGMLLHMDGARISNAAVALDLDLHGATRALGVDILSLGGTKNGLMFGEAIIVWDEALARRLRFVHKQGMQLASKMRYIAAQFQELFLSELWHQNAGHANTLAKELADRLQAFPDLEIVYPVEANGVFVRLPAEVIDAVREDVFFYDWEPSTGVVRFMVSYDNTAEDVDALISSIRRHLA